MKDPELTSVVERRQDKDLHDRTSAVSSRRPWLWILVLASAAAAAYFGWPKLRLSLHRTPSAATPETHRPSPPVPVTTATARAGSLDVYLNGLGVVTPIYTVTVKSRVDGQVMELHYHEGQMVKQGDLLVQIDPRPYAVQLAQAEGQLSKDQAVLSNARTDLARYEKLWSQNAIPQQQLATQQSLVKQYEANLQSDQAQIDAAKLNLVYCRIAAPITGRVGLRLVDPGNIIHASDNTGLVVITQLDPISVIFTIGEDQIQEVLSRLASGQHPRVEAWDRDLKHRLAVGTLNTIDNQIDQTTGTVKLRAEFDNSARLLFPSQFVNARVLVERKSGITVVPMAAIQRGPQSTYVYLVQPGRTVAVRGVSVGITENDMAEITSGLSPGDVVVTDGVDKLQQGTRVVERGASAAAPKPRSAK
ncbi:MAG: MdtA/MuxA family multidrug efflux RND transporter periplasmic adaptor subunit [Bryobacterales bacterium]|nr:MdtA/MuxA family multidrug efflux RND transporter periplasmic adaptor subunit [Bryobacterales bacterium]